MGAWEKWWQERGRSMSDGKDARDCKTDTSNRGTLRNNNVKTARPEGRGGKKEEWEHIDVEKEEENRWNKRMSMR